MIDDVKKVLGVEIRLEKILKEEVKDNGSDKENMERTVDSK